MILELLNRISDPYHGLFLRPQAITNPLLSARAFGVQPSSPALSQVFGQNPRQGISISP
jgi:hypothetical protein